MFRAPAPSRDCHNFQKVSAPGQSSVLSSFGNLEGNRAHNARCVRSTKYGRGVQRRACVPLSASRPSVSNADTLKRSIADEAGPKNGTDRSEAETSAIKELVKELEGTGSLEDLDLAGTEWDLVYTNSKGSSSGKIGPFVGRVKQVFPADMPGQYINKVDFGLVKADLLANYTKTARDNIDVCFVYIKFMLGPLSFKQNISSQGGFWKLSYTDKTFRVLYTNLGNVFILAR